MRRGNEVWKWTARNVGWIASEKIYTKDSNGESEMRSSVCIGRFVLTVSPNGRLQSSNVVTHPATGANRRSLHASGPPSWDLLDTGTGMVPFAWMHCGRKGQSVLDSASTVLFADRYKRKETQRIEDTGAKYPCSLSLRTPTTRPLQARARILPAKRGRSVLSVVGDVPISELRGRSS